MDSGCRGIATTAPESSSCHDRSARAPTPSRVSTMSPSHFIEYVVRTWLNDQL